MTAPVFRCARCNRVIGKRDRHYVYGSLVRCSDHRHMERADLVGDRAEITTALQVAS